MKYQELLEGADVRVQGRSLRWSSLFLRLSMQGGELLWRGHSSLRLGRRGAEGGEPEEGSSLRANR